MLIERPFRVALLFSIGIHLCLFAPLTAFVKNPQRVNNPDIAVTYIELENKNADKAPPKPLTAKKISLRRERPRHAPQRPKETRVKKTAEKTTNAAVKTVIPARDKTMFFKKKVIKKKLIPEAVLDLNSISMRDGTSDSINYMRAIRDRISSYVHKNYTAFMGEGEVLLHFVLNSDGTVHLATLQRSSVSGKLNKLCLDSIYRSSPFMAFPKEMNMTQAAFNISISFRKY